MRISDWSSDVCSSDLKDSDAFWYVRAKLRVLQAQDNQAQRNAMAKLRLDAQQTGGVEQSAAWYGLAYADWQRKDLSAAQEALAKAQQGGRSSPEIAALSVALALEKGDQALALSLAQSAWSRWPNSQGIALARIEAMQKTGRDQDAVAFLAQRIGQWPELRSEEH